MENNNKKKISQGRDLWKKYRFSLSSLGFVIVVISIVTFLILPLIKKIQLTADTIQEQLINNELDTKRIEQISQMEEDYKLLSDNRNYFDIILSSENEVDFIKKLESLADKTNNSISLTIGERSSAESSPKTKAANNKKKEEEKGIIDTLSKKEYLLMKIELKGDYNGLINFLNKLENINYRVNVISLEVKKSEEGELSSSAEKSRDIFGSVSQEAGGDGEKKEEKSKEVITSVISLVVYTKK